MRLLASAAVAAVLLAGCSEPRQDSSNLSTEVPLPEGVPPAQGAGPAVPQQAGPEAVTGFAHPAGADLFGYYMPSTDVQVGSFKLAHLHMGSEQEFAEWERGTRSDTYAPVMLVFEDVASPMTNTELGEVRSVTTRALADAYRIAGADVSFVDQHPQLGRITFAGKLDGAALAGAKSETASSNPTVLTGTLTVGDKVFPNVQFTWFGGD